MIFRFMDKSFAAVALVTAAAVAANARLQGKDSLLSQESIQNDASQRENVFVPRKMEPSMAQSADAVLDNTDRSLKNSNINSNQIQNENDLSEGHADEADLGLLNNDRKLQEVFDCDSCAERFVIADDAVVEDLVEACLTNGYDDEDCPGLIKCWDTSKVYTLDYAFYNQTDFNEPLNCWDTSLVTSTYDMFGKAYEFDQDISDFKMSRVTDMSYMFYSASTFNGDISGWKTSRVQYMGAMFYYAEEFDQDIGKWDVGKVGELGGMFANAAKFDSNINKWDVSSVYNFKSMFEYATSFNQKLGGWDTSYGKTMVYMFMGATAFNKPIGDWEVAQVTNMTYMFDSTYFDQSLDEWQTARVVDMYAMFAYSTFNQPIDSWAVKNVARFDYMFTDAKNFDQCLDSWSEKASNPTVLYMFTNSSCPIQTDPDPEAAPWCSDTCGEVRGVCEDTEEIFELKKKETTCQKIADLKKKKRKKVCPTKAGLLNCPATCNPDCKLPKFCKDDASFGNPGTSDCVNAESNKERCDKDKVFKNCRLTCDPECVAPLLA